VISLESILREVSRSGWRHRPAGRHDAAQPSGSTAGDRGNGRPSRGPPAKVCVRYREAVSRWWRWLL